MTDNLVLVFNGHFDRDKDLDYGRLSLNDLTQEKTEIIKASSSYKTKQYAESFHERGGLLPPHYRCKEEFFWKVSTTPIPMPNHRGGQGNFYQITPFEVMTDKGGRRSDFGVHLDANAPGSLGCIVTDAGRFAEFENWMSRLKSMGIQKVPLMVFYS